MASNLSHKIIDLIKPTAAQTFSFIGLALVIVLAANIRQIYALAGIEATALNAALDQFQAQTSGILTSQFASTATLVTFWAIIGMIAYLICWSAYNFMIEARNEVTLKTQYTNQGHRTSGIGGFIAKLVAGGFLLLLLMMFRPGFAYWLELAAPAFIDLVPEAIAMGVAAVLGLAAQLYLVLVLSLATIKPWYRK